MIPNRRIVTSIGEPSRPLCVRRCPVVDTRRFTLILFQPPA
jgi:hypothetical protein